MYVKSSGINQSSGMSGILNLTNVFKFKVVGSRWCARGSPSFFQVGCLDAAPLCHEGDMIIAAPTEMPRHAKDTRILAWISERNLIV